MDVTKEKTTSLGWAIAFSSFLTVLKTTAGFVCSSAALLASALDSLMDVGISSINYLSVREASKPPDEDHAYGHEKIESLASYTQGVIIMIFAFLIAGESFRRSLARNFVVHSGFALFAILLSVVLNFALTSILGRAERKTDSLILKAEKSHYLTDILSYAVIFLTLLLVRWTGWSFWDLLGGLLLAGYVAFLASRIFNRAAGELVDHSLAPGTLDELGMLIKNHPGVWDYHAMRTRKAGSKSFIDFHLVMKPDQSFETAHEITESLIEKIRERFRDIDITIHEDPQGGR